MSYRESVALRLATGAVTGLVVLYLLVSALQLAGIPWHLPVLVSCLLVTVALAWRAGGAGPAPRASWRGVPGWGAVVAFGAFLVFLACTAFLWNLHPDFIYHWGIKGARFHLAHGVDFDFLARPWNGHLHPDYPNLVPALFAVTALLLGAFDEVTMALWSAVFYLLAAVFGRELLRRLEVSELLRQAGVAVLGLTLTMFGVGYLTAGGADWLMVVAVSAAAVRLVGRPGTGDDLPLGMAAALAAASKIEGIALAAFLIAAHFGRRWRHAGSPLRRWLPRFGAAVLLPAASIVGLWAWQVAAFDLYQPTHVEGFDADRAAVVAAELYRSLLTVNWHGLTFCLLALPLLVAARSSRSVAAVLCLQLAFYVLVYLSSSVDPREWIRTSAARLFFHLVPTTLVLAVAAADRWSRRG